jgi:hypothetical protein
MGCSRSQTLKEGQIKSMVEKLENAKLRTFTIGTLMNIISQFKTLTGTQSCYIVNKVETFNVSIGDGASSSAISTSSHHGMALLVCLSLIWVKWSYKLSLEMFCHRD